MVNYQNSKIYKIEPICEHEENEIYIGSTTKEYLSQRMDKHRSGFKQWKNGKGTHVRSYDLFDKYGVENCNILLIENFPCEKVDELRTREGHFIRTLNCVNKLIAGRTTKEYKQVYYIENKEKINEANKQNYRKTLETSKLRIKNYNNNHKEKIDEYQKQYQIENLEALKKYRREYFQRKQEEKKQKQININLNDVIDV